MVKTEALCIEWSAGEDRTALIDGMPPERTMTIDLQTAPLHAVSHDLRTPLASIKASVGSLLQPDIDWTDDTRREFLLAVDEEVDRLDKIIVSMLDVRRVESGALRPYLRPVWFEDVIASALRSLGPRAEGVVVDSTEGLPVVVTDGGLNERALANLVMDAVEWSPPA